MQLDFACIGVSGSVFLKCSFSVVCRGMHLAAFSLARVSFRRWFSFVSLVARFLPLEQTTTSMLGQAQPKQSETHEQQTRTSTRQTQQTETHGRHTDPYAGNQHMQPKNSPATCSNNPKQTAPTAINQQPQTDSRQPLTNRSRSIFQNTLQPTNADMMARQAPDN